MLNNNAVLVRFAASQWTARKFDKKATSEVEANHGTNGEVGRFNKQLAAKKYLQELTSNISLARKFHYDQTLPWLDADGIRILPTANFNTYQEGMSAFHSKHDAALDRFVASYPDVIDEARYRLNGLFDPTEFPHVSEIRGKFDWSVSFSPVPEAGDFRVDLQQSILDQMERDMQQRLAANYDSAVLDLFERIYVQTSHVAERLENYTGTREGSFRDSLIENTVELASLLPRLNVTGNTKLNELARRIDQELCQYKADVLRENDAARIDVAAQAKAIAEDAAAIAKSMGALFA